MSRLNILSILSMLSIRVYELASQFPSQEVYNTTSQIKRAMISARLNIREGNVFKDGRKLTHFERALGSLEEVDECMIIAQEMSWITGTQFQNYREMYWQSINMLKKLIHSISSR